MDQMGVIELKEEARALARLSHPNIVQIYDFVQEENQYWIAMEYVEGKDLDSHINENGKYVIAESLRMCILIAEAMDYAHNRGVVHRDFKPSNVLVTNAGDVKVMDFGLAKLTHSSIATMEGSLIGSPAFMSPEQAMGKAVDERSDIYALGVTLYQLLTGKLPFKGDLKSVITQKIAGHQPSLKLLENQMPADLIRIVSNMMANNPDERPVTMNDVGQTLRKISQTES
ncbi:MAG: serine/threonine protein kinase [Desulfosarcina sp.]|nr:serine/threonine protein kinase [Desulfosarcina sp.]MBC2765216.1 serine/threonine protein kinase [Desulfosarcina sp.]